MHLGGLEKDRPCSSVEVGVGGRSLVSGESGNVKGKAGLMQF